MMTEMAFFIAPESACCTAMFETFAASVAGGSARLVRSHVQRREWKCQKSLGHQGNAKLWQEEQPQPQNTTHNSQP